MDQDFGTEGVGTPGGVVAEELATEDGWVEGVDVVGEVEDEVLVLVEDDVLEAEEEAEPVEEVAVVGP